MKRRGLHPKKLMLSIWWNWPMIVHYEFISQNQMFNLDKYCSQFDWVKAAIDNPPQKNKNKKNTSDCVIGSASSFIRTTPELTSVCRPDRNWYNRAGMSNYTCSIHLTTNFGISTYFDACKFLLMVRAAVLWKPVRKHFGIFIAGKDANFCVNGILS